MSLQINDLGVFFDKNNNRLVFDTECRLANAKGQKFVKSLLDYLQRESVSVLEIQLAQLEFFDLNTELFIYLVIKQMSKNKIASLLIKTNDQKYQLRMLIANILKINSELKIEFLINPELSAI
ncbi:hypothetical protein [Pseudoalteromonas tunicata]|jgi:hypothetical protein|uniref:Uncharacterized protein n=1 Tax=Pseudoalteromonas tunicata D2 TaxID=87626 RepID=A4C4F0_9GAMM|nr:hypothetical protein [Pseudoalteromonas tunicata]ATC97084.1 hypothetical protein PTUN_b0741 [Pseudoalteromonas tunicata]AXT33200.1 hypothetical protein D1819_20510 [Pseudoalteromonas tunicata]EAR30432.1 hypothetical protein PTD2_02646 [Pseudoalteromonas tunicata D2]MDP4984287.1 hypothetical protein [Pseudoalteromonas tunicata]MDP5214973.1 hypothetical protein [Pseudoalteromonas tunicata]